MPSVTKDVQTQDEQNKKAELHKTKIQLVVTDTCWKFVIYNSACSLINILMFTTQAVTLALRCKGNAFF